MMNANRLKSFSRLGHIALGQITDEIAERGFVFDGKDIDDLGCCLDAITAEPETGLSEFAWLVGFLMNSNLVADEDEPEAIIALAELRARARALARTMAADNVTVRNILAMTDQFP